MFRCTVFGTDINKQPLFNSSNCISILLSWFNWCLTSGTTTLALSRGLNNYVGKYVIEDARRKIEQTQRKRWERNSQGFDLKLSQTCVKNKTHRINFVDSLASPSATYLVSLQ